jgi:hypothetical protein
LSLIIEHMLKEELFRAWTVELLSYAKDNRTFSVKLTTWDVIFTSVVIPSGSWTQFLSPGELTDQEMGKSLSVLCLSSVWRAFLKSSTFQH